MTVPQAVREVERPVNTIVEDYGNPNKFRVRTRAGSYIGKDGKRKTRNGCTIGHIINGVYVPLDPRPSVMERRVAQKYWAIIVVLNEVMKTLLTDLEAVFNREDAKKIYCAALLKAAFYHLPNGQLQKYYEESWLSVLYPDVHLCANTVTEFWQSLGASLDLCQQFLQNRMSHFLGDDFLLLDGTVINNDSIINCYSDHTYKSKLKNRDGLNLLLLYSVQQAEPVGYEIFPGNMTDVSVFREVLKHLNPTEGILIGDKAFPFYLCREFFKKRDRLHYICPLKRSTNAAEIMDLYHPQKQLLKIPDVLYHKEWDPDKEAWLYAFIDLDRQLREKKAVLAKGRKEGDDSLEEMEKGEKKMGSIVLISDMDLDPNEIYLDYILRWNEEVAIRQFKQFLGFDTTHVQSDQAVLGEYFVRFISFIGSSRFENCLERLGLLQKRTLKGIRKILRKARKSQDPDGSWNLVKLSKSEDEVLMTLGLLPKPEKRGPGRPRKNPEDSGTKQNNSKAAQGLADPDKSKRGPGRPKGSRNKKTLAREEEERKEKEALEAKLKESGEIPQEPEEAKRKRGRPKGSKNKTPEQRAAEAAYKAAHKKPRGRPKKGP